MKNNITNSKSREARIRENFRSSGLTEEQYVNACKQYLYAKRSDADFAKLSLSEQERYLLERNILGYRFLGDRGLIEILNNFSEIFLSEIYSSIMSSRSGFINLNIDISTLLNNKDNILLVGAESYLNQISMICSSGKNVTIWLINTYIKGLLDIDFMGKDNITIKEIDIYNKNLTDINKYSYIFCIPPFGMRRQFKRGEHYGNDSSTIAAELLFENSLAPDGILSIIMPVKVNFSQMEAHFRQAYAKNLIEVVSLPAGTFSNTGINTYLYKFSKEITDGVLISDSIDIIGEKYNISDVTNIDSTWDFEKPFKKADEDISNILSKDHKKLSEISDVMRGKPLSKYAQETDNNEDFVYLDMRAIKEDVIDYSEAKKYTIDKDLSSEYLQNEDILIPNKGNTSKVVLYKNEDKNCVASANLLVIRAEKSIVEPEYLLTYLRSAIGQKFIKCLQKGAAMPFINHRDLEGIAVIVPTLAKQAEFLKGYNSRMDKYKKQLEQAKNNIAQLEQDVNDIICGKKQDFNN